MTALSVRNIQLRQYIFLLSVTYFSFFFDYVCVICIILHMLFMLLCIIFMFLPIFCVIYSVVIVGKDGGNEGGGKDVV